MKKNQNYLPVSRSAKCLLILLLGVFECAAALAKDAKGVHIIPEPLSVTEKSGVFVIDPAVAIVTNSSDASLKQTIQWFTSKVATSAGFKLATDKSAKKVIRLQLNNTPNDAVGKEGYTLSVSPSTVLLTASDPAGIFYGLQTLLQLLPADIESNTVQRGAAWTIPCVDIKDKPRFGWRGLMLDVSRHFFTKDEVKQYIDEMARYKFNTLHWHLADDEGWRIEIKSLPQLTKTGAWRVKRTGRWGTFLPPMVGETATDGGFYTQEDIKEVLQYAKEHFVTVLPEIDVPGHSLALIASYPNLSCTQLPYAVNAGRGFYTKDDNVLCVGNDSVFTMLDKIFTEVAQLFPNPYIHVGGDEAYKGFWAKCPKCQKRMADEHLQNEEELQSYFVRRLEKILQSKGKKLIGWDEILQGGLAPEATVMSWRGMSGGIAAAKMNHQVVMTPWDYVYLDLYQGEAVAEPPTYGMCRLSDSYNYEPVPDSIDEKLILGGQGNLWTESVPTFRQVEYMTWPRAIALSEVYWSAKNNKNWDDFTTRLEYQFPRLDAANVKYARSMYNAIFKPTRINRFDFNVALSTEIKGLDIYYTFDNTNPDQFSPKYDGKPISFPEGATYLNVVTYRNGKPVGAQINMQKDILAQRLGEKRHEY